MILDMPEVLSPLTVVSSTATIAVPVKINELTIKNTTLLLSSVNLTTSSTDFHSKFVSLVESFSFFTLPKCCNGGND